MPLERAHRKVGPFALLLSDAFSRYNRAVKRSVISSSKPDLNLQSIDDLFKVAGLVRNRRNTSPGVTARLPRTREDTATKQELVTPAPTPLIAGRGVGILKVQAWQDRKILRSWLWHGFSTRIGGFSRAYAADDAPAELNLGFTASDNREAVLQNRAALAGAVSGDPCTPLVTLRQFHSNLIITAERPHANLDRPRKADGIITATPGILLAIQTADCVPVLVADRKRRVVAAFHAGWRGTVKRIVEAGVGKMRLEFGSQPKDLIAAIGPGVGQCCYAVGEEVLSEFESQFVYARELIREVFDADPVRNKYPMLFLTQRAPGHSPIGPSLHLDLIEANRRQLLDAGVRPSAISSIGGCTSCHTDLFFSHRASQGHAGRMMSVIGICGAA